MLEAGFTAVSEFHYLHHDRDGRLYADVGEMAGRIAAAGAEARIALTLLPSWLRRLSHVGQKRPAAAGFALLPGLSARPSCVWTKQLDGLTYVRCPPIATRFCGVQYKK
jgi:hypothetical protein